MYQLHRSIGQCRRLVHSTVVLPAWLDKALICRELTCSERKADSSFEG